MTLSELKAQLLEEFRELLDNGVITLDGNGQEAIERYWTSAMDVAAEEERKRIERLMYDEIGYSEIHHEQTAGLIRLHDALIHNQQERCVICEQGHDVPHRCNDQRNQNRAIPNYPKP